MILMKFGGTSLRDGAALRTVAELVRARLGQEPVLVVSAHAGVTDALVEHAWRSVQGDWDLQPLREKHHAILGDLGLPLDLQDTLFEELTDLSRGIALVGELSPRSQDYVLSFGERMSARTVAAWLEASGIPATAVDAWDAGLRSDTKHGKATLVPDEGRVRQSLDAVTGIPVVTGFIAKDAQGNITTLGRNGSDTTAAFLGHALDAEEIQIWTDVDGVMTADPRIIQGAHRIPRMSFDEAAEIANHGGKVLHPASLGPAIEKEIPVRVLNTHRPQNEGTVILPTFEEPDTVVRCLAHKNHVTLVNLETSRMRAEAGFLARLFGIFEKHGISVDMVSTSEISISMTLDNTDNLDAAVLDLSALGEVSIEDDLSLVCVIGHGIRHRMGVPARVFGPLEHAGVEVRMISLGALKVNISLLVAQSQLETAVAALHDEFFGA